MTTATTLKDQILEEIDHLPVETLAEILAYVQGLRTGPNVAPHDEVWQAYLESEQEREEVYRRLADS
ncbi:MULTISPECIES: DUF2281 domain-containing protein [Cyanophyceae]|uniref:DUF2281 domain-containing protein n=1 Tax=Cyanophyceae TaxID=3028117 RepID=UPI0016898BB1|nr:MULTISPECIES: DUF2281 domain-containing protein [Cyanophyceae]MBD1916597.1 DUF2281 domain-containing protein [Phormidium sp. FACHB-77]MBD2032164.1 DUF2281 domain-containing protein [Phormidium sp. FACHB-322]MBD2053044.1 DUF2281 domain-containing protein [Leptolyngbya sp. FACHB-60]